MSRQRARREHHTTKKKQQKRTRRYQRVGQTMALTVALTASSALSQDTKRRDTFTLPPVDVQEQRSGYVPGSLGISRIPQPVQDIPQSITVVPRQILQERAAASFQDALRNVTGISLAAGEGGGAQGDNLTLRGFNARNDLFLDGIRDQGSYFRDVFNLESIEVLKGPSAVFFGRGSTGGILNQVSKTPGLEPMYSGTLSLGTGLLLRGTGDVNQPLSKTTAYRLNVMAHQENVVARDEIERRRFGLAPSIAFGLGTPTQFTLSYFVQNEDNVPEYGLPYLFGRPAPVDRANFYGLIDEDYEHVLTNIFTLRVDHRFSDQLSLRNTTRYSRTDREARVTTLSILRTPTLSTPLTDISVNRGTRPGRDTEESILINQSELTVKFDTMAFKHTVSTGLEVARETFYAQRYTHANVPAANLLHPEGRPDTSRMTRTTSARTDTKTASVGLYAVDQVRLLPQLDLIGGLRWDFFEADFNSYLNNQNFERTDRQVSYRAGLVFHPTPSQSYYFSYGTSFNPSAEALALAANNVDTAPEKNRNFEVGAKIGVVNDALSIQGALFRLEKTNARTLDPVTLLQVLEGEQRVQGFELGLLGRPMPRLNLFMGYTYLDSKTVKSNDLQNNVRIEGKQLQNTPRHSATLWASYDLTDVWQVGTGVQYVGERFANTSNTNSVPETIRWDATVAYQLNKHVQLRLNAINLTDELYFDGVHPSHVIPGAGRTFILSGNFTY
jgi:catecholate siderophore receptor